MSYEYDTYFKHRRYKPPKELWWGANYFGPPKIALVGTCSVGKTSIRRHFESLPGVVVIPEAAEDFFRNGRSPEELDKLSLQTRQFGDPVPFLRMWNTATSRTSWHTQGLIVDMIWAREHEAMYHSEQKSGIRGLLCDRAVVCAPVYTAVFGDWDHAQVTLDRFYGWIPTYAHICLLSPEGVPYIQSDIRSETPEERLQIHAGYLKFFEKYQIDYDLVTGSLADRIAFVDSLMPENKSLTE